MTSKCLSLDLSTSATGWALWDLETKELLSYGVIEPDFKNPTKKGVPLHGYPRGQVYKLRRLVQQVLELVTPDIDILVIEEINRGKNRLSQKTLDGFHYMLLDKLCVSAWPTILFIDSDGKDGWRSKNGLKLQLSDVDKLQNKENKKLNKKLGRNQKKLPVITQKTLACRFVNKTYDLKLDETVTETDGDVADAIGLGHFYLTKVKP